MKPYRFVVAILFVATLTPVRAAPAAAETTGASVPPTSALAEEIQEFRAAAHATDSLTSLADSATGSTRAFYEELLWQRQVSLHAELLAVAEKIRSEESRGHDMSEARRIVSATVRAGWPRYLAQV